MVKYQGWCIQQAKGGYKVHNLGIVYASDDQDACNKVERRMAALPQYTTEWDFSSYGAIAEWHHDFGRPLDEVIQDCDY